MDHQQPTQQPQPPPQQQPTQHASPPGGLQHAVQHVVQQSPTGINNQRYAPPQQAIMPAVRPPDGSQQPGGPIPNGGVPPPGGYYPPMYPGAGAPPDPVAGYRGYDPAYGMPPHAMGYPPPPMYAYQPHLYGGYPPYGHAPPHPHHAMGGYGYAPAHAPPPQQMPQVGHQMSPADSSPQRYDTNAPQAADGMPDPGGTGLGPAPYHTGTTADVGYMKYKEKEQTQQGANVLPASAKDGGGGEQKDDPDVPIIPEEIVPGAITARLKTYIKPRNPMTQDNRDRRARKNAQSRARASKMRDRIKIIETKPPEERTEEERQIWLQYESRRQKKNDRSRERALERKEEIDRILAKPESKRSKFETRFLGTALGAKKRKNAGDRMRRQRMKELGLSAKNVLGLRPGIPARGPLPAQFSHAPPHHMAPHGMPPHHPHPYSHIGEIPLSPMPTMTHAYHQQQSPGAYGSPGMMVGFPSPQNRSRSAAAPGVMETPVGARADAGHMVGMNGGGGQLPFIPPPGAYDPTSPRGHPNRVEQRRNPDGSMSISIGGPNGGPPPTGAEPAPYGGEAGINDVSGLYYGENGDMSDAQRQQGQVQQHDEHMNGKVDG